MVFTDYPFIKCFVKFPSHMDNVRKLITSLGLSHEGTMTDCYKKNDKIYDLSVYGINREDALKVGSE